MSRAQLDVLEALAGQRDVHVSVLHPSVVAWLRTTPIDRADPTVRSRRGDAEVLARPSSTAQLVGPPARRDGRTRAWPAGTSKRRNGRCRADGSSGNLARSRARRSACRPSRRPRSCSLVATRAFRCTPVTARSASSKCCATPSATCSSVIRRCAPTTSWSSVPTWPASSRSLRPCSAVAPCRVPVTVSDLSLGTENPVAGALAKILHTVAGRCTSSDVLAIAGLDPVRRRLGITADDLDRFATWTQRLGTRWGLDREHRSTWLERRYRPRHVGGVAAIAARRGGDAGARTDGPPSEASSCSTTSAATMSPASGALPSWSPASSTLPFRCRPPADRGVVRHPRRRRRHAVRRTVHRGMAERRRARSDRRRSALGDNLRRGRAAFRWRLTTSSPSSTESSPIAVAVCSYAAGG